MTAPDVQAAKDAAAWLADGVLVGEGQDPTRAYEVVVETLDALAARLEAAETELARLYDDVDKAQRIDNTGGDSAVSVILWSWAERRAVLAAGREDT